MSTDSVWYVYLGTLRYVLVRAELYLSAEAFYERNVGKMFTGTSALSARDCTGAILAATATVCTASYISPKKEWSDLDIITILILSKSVG